MAKIKEDVFNVVRFMLNNEKDRQTIMDVTGLSEISIERISKAETYAEYDEQRKARTAKIDRSYRKTNQGNKQPNQISIDDLIHDDSVSKLCEALNRQTEAIEKLLKTLSGIVIENVLRGA